MGDEMIGVTESGVRISQLASPNDRAGGFCCSSGCCINLLPHILNYIERQPGCFVWIDDTEALHLRIAASVTEIPE
jgi:hypothetical protein